MLNNKLSASEILELAVTHFELMVCGEDQWDPIYILRSQRMSKQLLERERIVMILGITGKIYTGFDALERLPANEWRVYLVDPSLLGGMNISSFDVSRWVDSYPKQCEPIGMMCKGGVSDWVEDNDLIMYGLSCASRVARQLYCDDYEPAAIGAHRPLCSSLQTAYSHVRELAHDLDVKSRRTHEADDREAADREYIVMDRMDVLMDLLTASS